MKVDTFRVVVFFAILGSLVGAARVSAKSAEASSGFYNDVSRIANALERIAGQLESGKCR